MSTGSQPIEETDVARWSKTACILCECNCGLEVKVEDRNLVAIRGDEEHPSSAGYLCEKPLNLDRYQNGADRLDRPLRRRKDGTYEAIEWDTAIGEIAHELAAIREAHGGEKILFYGGGGQGNHLGGAHGRALFHGVGARFMSNALAQEKTGEGWVDEQLYGNHTKGDFERSEVVMFVGKNPWQSHGFARARSHLLAMSRDPDRAIIVVDPRRSETAEMSDIHLQVKPGTDAWCMSAILATFAQEDLVDHDWLGQHVTGVEETLGALAEIDVEECARRCGVPAELIRKVARRYATAESAATYEDLGIQQAPHSTLVSYLNKLTWILTGNFAKPGGVHIHSWIFPLLGRWHAIPSRRRRPWAVGLRRRIGLGFMRRGAWFLRRILARLARGDVSRQLAERSSAVALSVFFESTAVPIARKIADRLALTDSSEASPVNGARAFSGLIPANAISDEILTDHPDRFRAMWIDSTNPAHSLTSSGRMREAFAALDLVVVVDVAFTETARCADYVLPASSQFEKWESTFFTLDFPENTHQLRKPALPPLPGTRPEPRIYADVMDALGVVDQQLLDQLTLAAETGPKSFALALFSSVEADPDLAGVVPYLLYKTLGSTFAEGSEATALVWGLAQLCAISQPDAVARAGFDEHGFDQGQQLYEAFVKRHEGVTFTVDRYSDAWSYVQHEDGKIHARIPVLLAELAEVVTGDPDLASAEFPLILSAGERRSDTANTIYRDPGWRRRDRDGAVRVSESDASELGIDSGAKVRVITESGQADTVAEINKMMQPGHISLPNGYGLTFPDAEGEETRVGVPLNELTALSRQDKFFGTPWHKNVPARLVVLTDEPDVSAVPNRIEQDRTLGNTTDSAPD